MDNSKPMESERERDKLDLPRKGTVILWMLTFLLTALTCLSPLPACLLLAALTLAMLTLFVRPVYAYYDKTHVALTEKAIEKLGKLGVTYSCWKELKEYLGKPPYDADSEGKLKEGPQGLLWGSIGEDYFGHQPGFLASKTIKLYNPAIVQNHYYNPINQKGLSDWEGEQDSTHKPVILDVAGWLLREASPQSAPERAQGHWEFAKKAYEHGSIRDAYSFLGRVVHLLEDMACPAHARNDNHIGEQKGYKFYLYNDHLHWDTLEQWCEGTFSPVQKDFKVSKTGEIIKYFPFFSKEPFTRLVDQERTPPCYKYLDKEFGGKGIGKPLSKDELVQLVSLDKSEKSAFARKYLQDMALDTAKKWWSDDTIPGNFLWREREKRDKWGTVLDENETDPEDKKLVPNQILDAWKMVGFDSERQIEEAREKIRKMMKEARDGIENECRGKLPFVDPSSAAYRKCIEEGIQKAREKISKETLKKRIYDGLRKVPDSLKPIRNWVAGDFVGWEGLKKGRLELLFRRRYRIKLGYLEAIVKERFPKVTERAAALIQRFYDSVRHVDLRGEEEKRNGAWRDKPIIITDKKPGIWLENCGGVDDDFTLEIEGKIPKGWKIKVEKTSGCKEVRLLKEEARNGSSPVMQKWMIEGVEPTPKEAAGPGTVLPLDKLREKYEKPFEGSRGAKLKITITPPEKSSKND